MRNLSKVPGDTLCAGPNCGHPLRGKKLEGHFNAGDGPCKVPGCKCASFVLPEGVRSQPARRPSLD